MDDMPASSLVIAAIGIVGFIFFLRWMKTKGFGVDCMYCGGNARFLQYVNDDDRSAIKKYFHIIEDRVPWPETILVCDKCRRVYETQARRPRHSGIKCKICGRTTRLADGKCLHCGALHEWRSISDCNGYRFLIPANIGLGDNGGDGAKDVRTPSIARNPGGERSDDD